MTTQIGSDAARALEAAAKRGDPVSNLEQLGVGQRIINILHENKVYDMEDLLGKRREDLLGMNNFGTKQLGILFSALSKYHLVEA
jgi:DNA-directed RNA polymerase alpha subunit